MSPFIAGTYWSQADKKIDNANSDCGTPVEVACAGVAAGQISCNDDSVNVCTAFIHNTDQNKCYKFDFTSGGDTLLETCTIDGDAGVHTQVSAALTNN